MHVLACIVCKYWHTFGAWRNINININIANLIENLKRMRTGKSFHADHFFGVKEGISMVGDIAIK